MTVEICELEKLDLASEILRSGGTIQIRALGLSMLPTIWPGESLTIRKPEDFATGDIVMFVREGRCFVHRLARDLGSAGWIARGDAMLQNDPTVARHELLGRVVAIERNRRNITPSSEFPWSRRWFALLLGNCGRLRSAALRVHVWQQKRAAEFRENHVATQF